MEQNEKKWYTSVTIIASILDVLSSLFGDTTIGQVVADPAAAGYLSDAITGIAGMFAIWGRVRASAPIGKKVV